MIFVIDNAYVPIFKNVKKSFPPKVFVSDVVYLEINVAAFFT